MKKITLPGAIALSINLFTQQGYPIDGVPFTDMRLKVIFGFHEWRKGEMSIWFPEKVSEIDLVTK